WVWVTRDRWVFVPNIIAPASSENGVAVIYGGDDVVRVEQFQIFDRWGSLVFSRSDFHHSDKANGWDGRVNGEEAAPGVYTWRAQVLFLDGRQEVFFGDVTVLR
ncbi:MAG TPA: gliding motility-associated C-terminal domain-containing protein, partial [Saprospiraceae bacterium]|nr:gliding motility-associated C-terminal domain-containing protein [Saprospiraceae bacterium]